MVIAIIALLAALLLPTLSRARAMARRTRCISNQHQLSTTWVLYSSDHDDRLVPNGYANETTVGTNRLWVLGDEHTNPNHFTNVSFLLDPRLAAFADYLKTVEIYKCPSDQSTVEIAGQRLPKLRSFSLNGFLNWETPAPDWIHTYPSYRNFAKSADLAGAKPAEIFSFVDVAPGNVCHSAFVTVLGLFSGLMYHLPSAQHENSSAISFADGHTEMHKWRDPLTLEAAKAEWNPNHFTMWVVNNQDLTWLQEHATVPK